MKGPSHLVSKSFHIQERQAHWPLLSKVSVACFTGWTNQKCSSSNILCLLLHFGRYWVGYFRFCKVCWAHWWFNKIKAAQGLFPVSVSISSKHAFIKAIVKSERVKSNYIKFNIPCLATYTFFLSSVASSISSIRKKCYDIPMEHVYNVKVLSKPLWTAARRVPSRGMWPFSHPHFLFISLDLWKGIYMMMTPCRLE